MLQKSFIGLIL